MAYFTPEELPDNKYYLFGKRRSKNLAEDLSPILRSEFIVKSTVQV
jgi:ATP-binding protein involved in chromosome partitioning